MSHRELSLFTTRTCSPSVRWSAFCACSLYCALLVLSHPERACACFLHDSPSGMRELCIVIMLSLVRMFLPSMSWAGDTPSARGVVLKWMTSSSKLILVRSHLMMSAFIVFTALSAKPFAWLLYGLVICSPICASVQNFLNSVLLNCGPPSVLRNVGHPRKLNQLVKILMA